MDPIPVPATTFEKYGSPLENANDADSFADAIIEHVEKIFMAEGGLGPTAILLHEDQATIVALQFENDEQKDAVSEFIPRLASQLGAHAIGFAAESWLAKSEDGEDIKVMPSEHPNRREAIFVSATWKDIFGKGHAARATYIERDEEGKVTSLFRNDKELDDSEVQGRFAF